MPEAPMPLRVRAYILCSKLLNGFLAVVQAGFTGFWLGVLRRSDFHALDSAYYRQQRTYWDPDYNRSGLFRWEREVVDAYFARCRRIVITAAGGGREVVALSRMGLHVEGFECNPGLAHTANALLTEEGLPPVVANCDRDVCPRLEGTYDGAIVGWSSFMLIAGRDRRLQFLRTLRQSLQPGAPVLLSFYVQESYRHRHAAAIAFGNVIRRLRGAEPLDPGDELIPNYVHSFTEQEVAAALAASGYRLARFNTVDYGYAVGIAVQAAGAEPHPRVEMARQ